MIKVLAQRISDWQAIIGFRNVSIHGCGQVNNATTQAVVQTELATLCAESNGLSSP
jgi:uncharacterized protein with HEPN domain